MHWNSLQEFLDMGGRAFFVWSSVAVTAAALAGELWLLRARRSHLPGAQSPHSNEQDPSS